MLQELAEVDWHRRAIMAHEYTPVERGAARNGDIVEAGQCRRSRRLEVDLRRAPEDRGDDVFVEIRVSEKTDAPQRRSDACRFASASFW